jgi:hypothetical protein
LKVVYEFVVADRADTQLLAQSQVDRLSLPYFRCFGLDPVNLATLYFLINDKPYCDTYLQQFAVLHYDSKTCDSLVEMPQSLCDSLASLASQQLARVLENWREKEGFSLSHWHDSFKRNVLLNLVELSKECRERRQSLILKVRIAQRDNAAQITLH